MTFIKKILGAVFFQLKLSIFYSCFYYLLRSKWLSLFYQNDSWMDGYFTFPISMTHFESPNLANKVSRGFICVWTGNNNIDTPD